MVIDEVLAAVLPNALRIRLSEAALGAGRGISVPYRGNVPLAFSFRSSELYAKIGTQATTLVNDVRFENQRLTGKVSGDLGIPSDTVTASYDLEFELFLRDGVLNGAVTTRVPCYSAAMPIAAFLGRIEEGDRDALISWETTKRLPLLCYSSSKHCSCSFKRSFEPPLST